MVCFFDSRAAITSSYIQKANKTFVLCTHLKKKQDLGMVFAYLNIKKTESKWKSHLIFCPLITMFTYVVM